jgi:Zn-dependent peptidase ImmA (M78 family)
MTGLTAGERMLVDLGIREPSEIDLEAIAASRGAFVRTCPLDSAEAMIVGRGSKAVILVNERSRWERQRFSIAHEIGHWHHHRGQVLFCGPADIGNPRNDPLNPERQADDFASDLILPGFMFMPRLHRIQRLRMQDISEIADEFQASRTATLLKAVGCRRHPIIVACYGRDGLIWFRRSDLVATWWRLRSDLNPETFAGQALLASAAPEQWPRSMPAEEWFDFRGADRYEVKEQCFMPTHDRVIAVLTIPEEGLV